MVDSLNDILSRRNVDEPAEIRLVKEFVMRNLQMDVSVALRDGQIIISVSGSSAAGALRMQLHDLQETCKLDKKPLIRIGS